jgi:NAD(P)-dependent dehydrogenase (short-subunit alcohol dehydrogenase family)
MGTLDGKVAIVTGAGRGIGRGHALALAAEGAAVVVNDIGVALDGSEGIQSEPADEVAAEIRAAGGHAMAHHDDVASWSGGESLVEAAVDAFGRVDVLVNNAGVLRDAMSFTMDEDSWDAVVRVHLKGHFSPSRAAIIHWRERYKAGHESGGRIVNTVSEAGLYGGTGQANYVAAKAGIAGMTIGLAREVKRYGVTVNAIAPRARTRMTETVLGDYGAPPAEGFDEWDPDNVGPVVAWLAGPSAAGITAQVFVVFGGRIHLMSGWDLVGEIEQDHRWTVDEIAARADELFGDRWRSTPRMGFGR